MKRCYSITPQRIRARLTINALYKNETARITREWAKVTRIPPSNFAHPTFITGYGDSARSGRTYQGTLRIKVSRGTSLRRRILASIEAVGARVA